MRSHGTGYCLNESEPESAAGAVAEFSRIHTGQNLKFLDRIDGRPEHRSANVLVVVVEAVQGEVVGDFARTSNVETAAETQGRVLGRRSNTGHQNS